MLCSDLSQYQYHNVLLASLSSNPSGVNPDGLLLNYLCVLIHLFAFKLFLEVGNENANKFWAANLPPEDEIHKGALPEQRAIFHRRKYRERKYRKVLEGMNSQEELNQVCVWGGCVSICTLHAPSMWLFFFFGGL